MLNFKSDKREQKIETLNELIELTRDGAEFYSDAAKSVDNPKLKLLFENMASSKQGLVGAMSREVRESGAEPADSGTLRGSMHQFYTDIRATLRGKDSDYAYVSELEAAEDRIMAAFHSALKDSSMPEGTRETVMGYLPKVKAQHDAMRDRKWQMQSEQRH
jgi:uncharacterized protein (TIGR02284 family)